MFERLHMSNVVSSGTSGSYGNSLHTGQPPCTFASINSVGTADHKSSHVLAVLPMLVHDVPVSIIPASGNLPKHTTS